MSIARIDAINLVLVVVSAVIAWLIPFELFLFSYAVLGPLHYVTEIAWLHKKAYFVTFTRTWVWPVVALAGLAMLSAIGRQGALIAVNATIVATLFGSAFVCVYTERLMWRILGTLGVVCAALVICLFPAAVTFVAIVLPTVLHVFVFTLCFMIFGALKSKSWLGFLAALVFFIGAGLLLFSSWSAPVPNLSPYVHTAYQSFELTNRTILAWFPDNLSSARSVVYATGQGVAVMRFLAFVFTYHYLNWFSKTSIIRWYETTRRNRFLIGFFWLTALVVYAYDYRIGLVSLYALSMLHVIMEFPLNHSVFIGISRIMLGGKR